MFIYLACERWCKHAVITLASTRPCYINVIICDVMLCVRERGVCVCVCEKSSVLRVFGPRPWESPRNVSVKSDSLHFTLQPTLTSCSALQRSPLPWWSCNPLDPFLMESWILDVYVQNSFCCSAFMFFSETNTSPQSSPFLTVQFLDEMLWSHQGRMLLSGCFIRK